MKKRRLKRKVICLFNGLFFALIGLILITKFDLWNRTLSFINESGINIKDIYLYKPKVKIIDEESKIRPIAVSINNNHNAWPHAGLQDAYLCYELIAEGGITRILAFFKDKDTNKIGSVRSARHYFLDYVLENDAIFVHYGQSPQALSDLSSLKINNINGMVDGNSFYRDKNHSSIYEHTAFTNMERINKYIKSKNYRTETDEQLLKYSPIKVDYSNDKTLKEATKVKLVYSDYTYTSYEYDSENMVYKQSISDKKHVDKVTNKQYTVKNIIVYEVKNTALDNKGRQELENLGRGKGYYITNGNYIEITWEKDTRSDKTIYKDSSGKELTLNDGNTWIHIIPKGKKITIK